MGLAPPSGKYSGRMLNPGGWPDVDEDAFLTRAEILSSTLVQLSTALESWLSEHTEIASGGIWSGSSASAGSTTISKTIQSITQQQAAILTTITWYNQVFSQILSTKVSIFNRVVQAEAQITSLESTSMNPETRSEEIDRLIQETHQANVIEVESAAVSSYFADWSLTDDQKLRALDRLMRGNRTLTATPNSSGASSPGSPSTTSDRAGSGDGDDLNRIVSASNTTWDDTLQPAGKQNVATEAPPPQPEAPAPDPSQPAGKENTAPVTPAAGPSPAAPPLSPAQPAGLQNSSTQAPSGIPGGPISTTSAGRPQSTTPVPGPVGVGSGSTPVSPNPSPTISGGQSPSGVGGTTGGAPQAPAATASPGAGAGQAPVSTPQQDFQKGFADVTKAANANPMPVNQTPLSPATPASAPAAPLYPQPDTTGSTTPAAATNHSAPVTNAPTPTTPATPAAPTGAPPMPLGNPSTPAPAAPVPPTAGPAGPTPTPASTNQGATGGAAAPVPISAARAERDAMAAAATPGALRRQGNNPRQLARHIAAALNVDTTDPSLYWITAVTSDGHILAANNYGLAYIPEHVHLPEQVRMVTADESIPAQTRGTWATYPLLAVQEWARHHNVTLQAVAGTEENLKGFDLGAARDILSPDDLPDSGKMQGRNRLEVIAPEVATKLAGISAGALTELLPPAPADNTPPPDNRMPLLLEVCKPLLSANPDRAGAHLKAMVNYADHLQTVALHRAHHAQDAELQRAAIADWIYWQHVSVLSSDALSAMVS